MFLTRPRADMDRSPWGDFWFSPVSHLGVPGAAVSADGAMQMSAVYAAVRVLAETFAALPFMLYRTDPDGARTQVRDHWLYQLLARKPNDWQNAFEWREMMQGHLVLRGNAFNRIVANGAGEIEALLPIHPDRVKIEVLDNGNWRYRIRNGNNTETILTRGDVWHLRGLSSDGIVGLSPIDLARDNVGIGLSAQSFGARFFANDARPSGGYIEHPSNFKDRQARETWRESWQQQQSGVNRGKTAVLEYGMKYHELGLTNVDAQFIETRKFQITEIARIFRVPPHLIGDLERATFTNIEQQSLEFIMHTMTPWAERWEAAIESDLLLEEAEGVEDALEVGFDFTSLMRGDSKARAEYIASGIMNGWLNRNEARVMESLNPAGPELGKYLQPLNMVEAGQQPLAPPGGAPKLAAPAGGNASAPAPAYEADDRLRGLLRANAERLARRIVAGKPCGAEIVAEAMAVPLDSARVWLAMVNEGADEATLAASLLDLASKGTA